MTDEDIEEIKATLIKWREEFATSRGLGDISAITEARDAQLSKFIMDRIHRLCLVEFSLGTGPQHSLPAPDTNNRPAVITFKGADVPTGRLPEDFPGPYPARFLNDAVQIDVGDPTEFASSWQAAVSHLFKAKLRGEEEFAQFVEAGLSNGRTLTWAIMDILPHRNFPLHAHPNIEAIQVVRGTLHELRLAGLPPARSFSSDAIGNPLGPDLSSDPWTFEHNVFPQGSFLVNEVGATSCLVSC